jgi:hypothetical protein
MHDFIPQYFCQFYLGNLKCTQSGQNLLTLFSGRIVNLFVNQGFDRAGIDAGRFITVGTAVALIDAAFFVLPGDNPERTDHDAHPAADTELGGTGDHAARIALQGPGQTGIQAGRLFAVAALQREKTLAVSHDMHPVLGLGILADGGQQGFAEGMLNRAGQFTAAAAETEFRFDEKFFHDD